MSSIVDGVTTQDIKDIAAYFYSQRRNHANIKPNQTTIKLGKQIYTQGIGAKQIKACVQCHGTARVRLQSSVYPLLSRQHPQYLIRELNAFKSGKRHNDADAVMRGYAKKLSAKEINAVAEYLSTM